MVTNVKRKINSTTASITAAGKNHSGFDFFLSTPTTLSNDYSRNESAPYIYAHTYRKNPSCPSEIPGETVAANDITATFELRSSTYGSYASSNQPRQPIYHSLLSI